MLKAFAGCVLMLKRCVRKHDLLHGAPACCHCRRGHHALLMCNRAVNPSQVRLAKFSVQAYTSSQSLLQMLSKQMQLLASGPAAAELVQSICTDIEAQLQAATVLDSDVRPLALQQQLLWLLSDSSQYAQVQVRCFNADPMHHSHQARIHTRQGVHHRAMPNAVMLQWACFLYLLTCYTLESAGTPAPYCLTMPTTSMHTSYIWVMSSCLCRM